MSETPWSGDPEALLAHAGWVRSLARSLTRDPDRAEDVEQQTWLGVLGRPPADARNLRAWLGCVVRNTARQLGRGETRRRGREHAVPPAEDAPAATELAERAELQREVVSTVLALEEPYRTTVLLRYWGAHSPAEIARLQGLPAGTVRSRLHRAHEELRAALDRRVEGGRRAWSATLLAWGRSGETRKVAASASSLLAGVAVMSWKVILGLVVVAGLGAGWALRAGPSVPVIRPPEPIVDSATSAAPPRGLPVGAEELRGAPTDAAEGGRTPVPVAASLHAIRGTVAAPDGEPVGHARLTLYPDVPDWTGCAPLGTGTSDAAGNFRLEDPVPGAAAYVLHAAADGYRSTTARPVRSGDSVELVLSPFGELAGYVRDAETGEPLADATVVWARKPHAKTDAHGHYRLRGVPTGRSFRFYARAQGYAEDAVELELSEPEGSALDFELRRGAPLVVEVFDQESGLPVARADVHGDPNVTPLGRTDASGRCEVRVLEGEERFLRVVAEGYFPFIWSHRVADVGRPLAPRIPLTPMGQITGIVTDGSGGPVAGVEVQMVRAGAGFGFGSLGREEREALDLPGHAGLDSLHRWSERSDDRGRFRLPVLPGASPQRVVATRPDGVVARSEPVVVSSSRARVHVAVDFGVGATVSGRVLFNREPRSGVEVRWQHADSGDVGAGVSDDTGRFELTEVRPGAVAVYVVDVELGSYGSPPRADLVVAAGEVREQDLAWEAEIARIRGRVVSEAGAPLAGIRVEAATESAAGPGWPRFVTVTERDGTYAVEVRAAVTYRVTAGRHFIDRSRSGVAAGATDVDLVLPELGVVPVQLVDAETREPISVRSTDLGSSWRVTGDEAFRWSFARFSHTGFAEVHLPLGLVDLSVFANDLGYAPALLCGVRVTQEEGRRPVELPLTRGVEAGLAFTTEVADDASIQDHRVFLLEESQLALVRGRVEPDNDSFQERNVNGTRFWLADPGLLEQLLEIDGRGRAHVRGLAPGSYFLRAYPPDLRFEPESFTVAGDTSDPIEVRYRRR